MAIRNIHPLPLIRTASPSVLVARISSARSEGSAFASEIIYVPAGQKR